MKVSECMTRDVVTVSPERTLQEAARLMCDMDVGVMPVGENDRLVGMITDRDIAVRAVAEGKGPQTSIRDVMTQEIHYCRDSDDVREAARQMGELQVRRLPVLDDDKRLVGIVALGDLACADTQSQTVGDALGEISREGGTHSQSQGESSRNAGQHRHAHETETA